LPRRGGFESDTNDLAAHSLVVLAGRSKTASAALVISAACLAHALETLVLLTGFRGGANPVSFVWQVLYNRLQANVPEAHDVVLRRGERAVTSTSTSNPSLTTLSDSTLPLFDSHRAGAI
jgi:hypothetical protein